MLSPGKHLRPCLEVIIETVNNQGKIKYGELADRLGFPLARQRWSTVLHPIARKLKKELGNGFDLTWVVVYATGPAKGLGHYFSNDGKATGSEKLDPKNQQQVAEYERTLKEIYKYTYELQKVAGEVRVIKAPRR